MKLSVDYIIGFVVRRIVYIDSFLDRVISLAYVRKNKEEIFKNSFLEKSTFGNKLKILEKINKQHIFDKSLLKLIRNLKSINNIRNCIVHNIIGFKFNKDKFIDYSHPFIKIDNSGICLDNNFLIKYHKTFVEIFREVDVLLRELEKREQSLK